MRRVIALLLTAVVTLILTQPVALTSSQGAISAGVAAIAALICPSVTGRLFSTVGLLASIPFLTVIWASLNYSQLPEETISACLAVTFAAISGSLLAAKCDGFILHSGILVGLILGLSLSILVALVTPAVGLVAESYNFGALRGIYEHRNQLGYVSTLCAIVASFYDWRALRWARIAVPITVLLIMVCLLGSASSTALALSIATLTVSFGVRIIFVLPARVRPVAFGILGFSVVGLAAAVLVFIDSVTAALGRDATLTGRTTIWPWVIEGWKYHPTFGWGWGSVWPDSSLVQAWISGALDWRVYHSHDSYLDLLIQVGWVGLGAFAILFVLAILSQVISVRRGIGGVMRSLHWALIFLIACMAVYSVVETRISQSFGIFLLVCAASLPLAPRVDTRRNNTETTPQRQNH